MRRVETVSGSGRVGGGFGSASIKNVNLSLAVCCGIRASSAASRQGSRSSRASADRTLSSIPFFSSPICAKRKASNSDLADKTVAEFFMPITKLSCPRRSHGKGQWARGDWLALNLLFGRSPRQTRNLPTTRPADEAKEHQGPILIGAWRLRGASSFRFGLGFPKQTAPFSPHWASVIRDRSGT